MNHKPDLHTHAMQHDNPNTAHIYIYIYILCVPEDDAIAARHHGKRKGTGDSARGGGDVKPGSRERGGGGGRLYVTLTVMK